MTLDLLSPRLKRVAVLACLGFRDWEIGVVLGIQEASVGNCMKEIFNRTGYDTRLQLACDVARDCPAMFAGVGKEQP